MVVYNPIQAAPELLRNGHLNVPLLGSATYNLICYAWNHTLVAEPNEYAPEPLWSGSLEYAVFY